MAMHLHEIFHYADRYDHDKNSVDDGGHSRSSSTAHVERSSRKRGSRWDSGKDTTHQIRDTKSDNFPRLIKIGVSHF